MPLDFVAKRLAWDARIRDKGVLLTFNRIITDADGRRQGVDTPTAWGVRIVNGQLDVPTRNVDSPEIELIVSGLTDAGAVLELSVGDTVELDGKELRINAPRPAVFNTTDQSGVIVFQPIVSTVTSSN